MSSGATKTYRVHLRAYEVLWEWEKYVRIPHWVKMGQEAPKSQKSANV
jgi:hypothetical protein